MTSKEKYTLNFPKKNWRKSKLGEFVREVNETSRNPIKDGLNCIVGLEHIDTETIHLKRFAELNNTTTFTKVFKKGQILFGRRRAYLKKAAQANFNGICSGDITVMEAKDGLLPELLPFLIHNDRFFDYAIKNSAGSLSPRVKFKDLAEFEFLLPPKEDQTKLAKLLWAADNVVEKDKELLEKLENMLTIYINQSMIHCGNNSSKLIEGKCGLVDSKVDVLQLKDCLSEKPAYGANASAKEFQEDAPRYIRITDIDDFGNLLNEEKVTIASKDYEQYILNDGDFLFARTGNTVGKTLLFKEEYGKSVFAGYLIRFRLNTLKLNPKFLFYFTKSLKYEIFKRKVTKVGAQPNINSEEYQSMYLPVPPIDMQDLIITRIDNINERITNVKSKLQSSQALLKSLINEVFV
ncbi:MAG: restriction endonuclease subunit S [Leptospiraceae bacterium]|nr:restriction endonuclease subunit S [Leptospiraceae bacterium]